MNLVEDAVDLLPFLDEWRPDDSTIWQNALCVQRTVEVSAQNAWPYGYGRVKQNGRGLPLCVLII